MIIKIKRNPLHISSRDVVKEVSLEEAKRLSEIYDIEIMESIRDTKKIGLRCAMVQELIYKIGGIEEFLLDLSSYYSEYNLVIYYMKGDTKKLLELASYVDIKKFNVYDPIVCDVMFINNYHMVSVLDNPLVKFSKAYLVIHADFRGHKAIENINLYAHPKLTGYISVSKSAKDGLMEVYGIDSLLIYNFINTSLGPVDDGFRVFITLSRATKEKGIHRILLMAKEFIKQKKKFIWFLCGSMEEQCDNEILVELKKIPNIIFLPPTSMNKELIKYCHYLVQLSSVESFCYSINEALLHHIPVITTNYPEALDTIVDGKNGYIVDMELSNLNVDKIFNEIPKDANYIDKCNKQLWEDLFVKGEIHNE